MDVAVGVAGVVDDAGDHPGPGESGMGPHVLIHAERINTGKASWSADPAPSFGLDTVPQGPPGDAELMGESGDGGVVSLQSISGPPNGPVGQNRPFPGQRVVFAEDLFGAVLVLALPQPLGPDQPDWTTETGNVVQVDPAPAMADGNNAAGRAARQCLVRFNMDDQATGGLGNSSDVNAGDA